MGRRSRLVIGAVAIVVGAAAGLFYLENRGLPTSGWEAWAGDGPEPATILDGTSGFETSFNVTHEAADGDPRVFARYLDEIPPGSVLRLRFETDVDTSVEVDLGRGGSASCEIGPVSNRSGTFPAGTYHVASDRDRCEISIDLNGTLVDERDGAPIEWSVDLRGPGTWWFSFDARRTGNGS